MHLYFNRKMMKGYKGDENKSEKDMWKRPWETRIG